MVRVRSIAVLAAMAALCAAAAPAVAVTGGKPASRPYPFMAALYESGTQICGGSLVHAEWVLTAAHCVEGVKNASAISFRIGGNSLGSPQNETRTAAQIIVHPDWDSDTFRYDAAVVKLDQASTKAPIRLASPDTERLLWSAGRASRVIGYGVPNGEIGQLFEADIAMVSDAECGRNYDLTGGGFDPVTMVCAGELYGVEDSCFGDSGGPLMVPEQGGFEGTLLQVGVVSWGFLCGVPTQYGVYSRVADRPLYDWIQSRVGKPLSPGSIAGRVTDSRTGAALAAASVDCGAAGAATTGSDGRYALSSVAVGSYGCAASKTGYVTKTKSVSVSSGSTSTLDFALRASRN